MANTLEYPLIDGYVHNWLVAGPLATGVQNSYLFADPADRLQIARNFYQAEVGIEDEPAEFGKYTRQGTTGQWEYVRTLHDHWVDLSAFYHSPHYLCAWAYTQIDSPIEQELSFVLATNGPADVWIDGQHIHRQEHFHPGIPNRVRFQVKFHQGVNRIMVRLEQVVERECSYTMSLQLLNLQGVKKDKEKVVRIPTLANNAKRRMKLELLFEACHIRQDVYARKDEIIAYLPEGPAANTEFNIRLQTPSGRIYAEVNRSGVKDMRTEQPMGFPYQSPAGNYHLLFVPTLREYHEMGLRIARRRRFYAANNTFSTQPYGTYEERRKEALLDAARRDGGIFSEIAKMELDYWLDVNEKAILESIDAINQRREDAASLLCGLLVMLCRYADKEKFPVTLKQPLEDCILNFKYWHDEPGSDRACYTSEPGSILFHTCEVLAGQLYPDLIFTNTNQAGRWHVEKGERLALEWLQQRAHSGFAEWDSNTSFEQNTLALAALASLSDNDDAWELASLMLDKMFFTMAANSFKGVFGSTHGCSDAVDIKTGYRESTSGIGRLLWGQGIFNEHILGVVALACSSYELHSSLTAIAAELPEALWSKEQHVGALYGAVNKATYKTPDFMLCSAQDWRPGEPGCQEHVWQATLGPAATVFTSHPACASEESLHSPNYWRGNAVLPRVAQWKDTLVAIYNSPASDWMGFTHAYFPVHAMDEYKIEERWAFGKVGDGYIALVAANGLDFQIRGDNAYRELRSPGTRNSWLCLMGRAALDGSFDEFKAKVLALPLNLDGLQISLTNLRGEQIQFGWEGSLLLNGEAQPLNGFKHYDSPYCSCELGAPMMDIVHGGGVLRLHFEG